VPKIPLRCVKRLGWAAFAFFFIKGLVWIALGVGTWSLVSGGDEPAPADQPVQGSHSAD